MYVGGNARAIATADRVMNQERANLAVRKSCRAGKRMRERTIPKAKRQMFC